MKGSVFAKTLPKTAGAKREQMIFDAVRRRDIAPIEWVPITTSTTSGDGRTYTATIKVSKDALRIGDAKDSFRATVNHRTAQHIADELGVVLPTPYLSDQIWKQAQVRPSSLSQAHKSWVDDGTMSHTRRMIEQSQLVDKLVAKEQERTSKTGLIADVGKDWVTTKRLWEPYDPPARCEKGHPRAANYGWHLKQKWLYTAASDPATYVLQPVGLCHTIPHTDYSQVVRLVRRDVNVCGPGLGDTGCMVIDIRSIAGGHTLSPLVSHTGVLSAMRHPDVPPSCEDGKRCAKDAGEEQSGNGMGQNGNPPVDLGPISCPIDCEKLPPPGPDPTYGVEPYDTRQAGMSAANKVMLVGAGAVVGYFALKWLLPSLSSRAAR